MDPQSIFLQSGLEIKQEENEMPLWWLLVISAQIEESMELILHKGASMLQDERGISQIPKYHVPVPAECKQYSQ